MSHCAVHMLYMMTCTCFMVYHLCKTQCENLVLMVTDDHA